MTGFAQRYRDEGRQEGERRVLERLLQRLLQLIRCLVCREYRKVTEASMEDLETWAENVLDAHTLDCI